MPQFSHVNFILNFISYFIVVILFLLLQLNSGLNVYLEYSNEVWNWQFQQANWNLAEAQKEVKKTVIKTTNSFFFAKEIAAFF